MKPKRKNKQSAYLGAKEKQLCVYTVVLTATAFDFVVKRWVRKLTEEDWRSILLFKRLTEIE